MKSMRVILAIIFFTSLSIVINAQDKIYLRDNSLLEGIITDDSGSKIEFVLKDKSRLTILKKDIALIIYENGYSEVMSQAVAKTDKKEDERMSEWMIGTNILLPLHGMMGFSIEKNISKRYSIGVGEAFHLNDYYGFGFTTSFLNNFYLGKGKIKWMNSMGLNLTYTENGGYYPYEINPLADYILPYRPPGLNTNISIDFTVGTGMHVDISKHFALSTQFFIGSLFHSENSNMDLSFFNSGFCFFYKF